MHVTKQLTWNQNALIQLIVSDIGKVKYAYEPSGPSDQSLSRFVFYSSLDGALVASPSQGYPPALNLPVPINTPGWREAL